MNLYNLSHFFFKENHSGDVISLRNHSHSSLRQGQSNKHIKHNLNQENHLMNDQEQDEDDEDFFNEKSNKSIVSIRGKIFFLPQVLENCNLTQPMRLKSSEICRFLTVFEI